jgi:hypothetical protein
MLRLYVFILRIFLLKHRSYNNDEILLNGKVYISFKIIAKYTYVISTAMQCMNKYQEYMNMNLHVKTMPSFEMVCGTFMETHVVLPCNIVD